MIVEKTINGVVFLEQRTYYVYLSEEDRQNGKHVLATSDENLFNELKEKEANKNKNERRRNIISESNSSEN